MIFVTLGTQDKSFDRLLKAIDNEIDNGNIKDEVVVQAGYTKYESKNMKIFDLIPQDEFDKYFDKANLIITHGGVGSILSGVKRNKKVIAAARLSKYGEHTNDHQKQIIKEFADQGYILELSDFSELGSLIKKSKTFKPKKFESNTKNMVKLISNYIEEDNHTSWFNKYREIIMYLFFGICTTLVNIITFTIFRKIKLDIYTSNVLAWVLSVLFAFITNKLFVFESNNKNTIIKECLSFFIVRLFTLVIDMGLIHLLIKEIGLDELLSKIISNIVVIIVNYILSKLVVFKKIGDDYIEK